MFLYFDLKLLEWTLIFLLAILLKLWRIQRQKKVAVVFRYNMRRLEEGGGERRSGLAGRRRLW